MATRSYRVGFMVTDTHGDIRCLECAPSSGSYDCFENADVNYQVTNGTTLWIGKFMTINNTAGGGFVIGYGDDAKDNSTIPTAWKAKTSTLHFTAANVLYENEVAIPIPSQKYAHVLGDGGAAQVTIFGIEVA